MALSISDFIPGAQDVDNKGIRIDFDTLIGKARTIKVDLTFKNLETEREMKMVSATTCEGIKFYAWIEQREWKEFCSYNNLCHECGTEKIPYFQDETKWNGCPNDCDIEQEFLGVKVLDAPRSEILTNLTAPGGE